MMALTHQMWNVCLCLITLHNPCYHYITISHKFYYKYHCDITGSVILSEDMKANGKKGMKSLSWGTEHQAHGVCEFRFFSYIVSLRKGQQQLLWSCLNLMKDAKCEYFYCVYE